jgi:hypothetical protein
MNKKILIIVLAVIIALALMADVYFIFSGKNVAVEKSVQNVGVVGVTGPKTVAADGSTAAVVSGNLSCKDSPNYFIISKGLTDSVGSDILIKYKTGQSQSLPCVYNVATEDFEIKNVQAEYFLAVIDHFLILDSGTAPYPRGLIVYDLNTREKVYTDKYSQPFSVAFDTLTYWTPVGTKATNANCPELSEYSAGGLGAEIEQQVTLNLTTLVKKNLGPSRCSATQ